MFTALPRSKARLQIPIEIRFDGSWLFVHDRAKFDPGLIELDIRSIGGGLWVIFPSLADVDLLTPRANYSRSIVRLTAENRGIDDHHRAGLAGEYELEPDRRAQIAHFHRQTGKYAAAKSETETRSKTTRRQADPCEKTEPVEIGRSRNRSFV
jgi:hypothetical protein